LRLHRTRREDCFPAEGDFASAIARLMSRLPSASTCWLSHRSARVRRGQPVPLHRKLQCKKQKLGVSVFLLP
jgi:hypothetical protein